MKKITELCTQFFWFSIVGALGFGVDAAVLDTAVHRLGYDPHGGRVVSLAVAATTTWLLNRTLTFRRKDRGGLKEWFQYLALMIFGASINFAVYSAVVARAGSSRPALLGGLVAGTLTALFINFFSARRLLGEPARTDRRQPEPVSAAAE